MAECCVLHSDGSGTAAPRYARSNVLTADTKATKCGTKPSRAARGNRKWNGRPILGVNVLKQPYEGPTQELNDPESRLTNEIHDPFSHYNATRSVRGAITVRGRPGCAQRGYT